MARQAPRTEAAVPTPRGSGTHFPWTFRSEFVNATLDTVEQEVRQQVQQNIDAFVMPKPMRGQSVLFYRNGTKGGQPEVGFVLKVGTRNLMVNLASGLAQESVRHIDDPRLQLNDA